MFTPYLRYEYDILQLLPSSCGTNVTLYTCRLVAVIIWLTRKRLTKYNYQINNARGRYHITFQIFAPLLYLIDL